MILDFKVNYQLRLGGSLFTSSTHCRFLLRYKRLLGTRAKCQTHKQKKQKQKWYKSCRVWNNV